MSMMCKSSNTLTIALFVLSLAMEGNHGGHGTAAIREELGLAEDLFTLRAVLIQPSLPK